MRPKVKRVEIGDCTLYRGDCCQVLKGIEDESIDMIWTDPPFGHGNADGDLLSRRAEAVGDGIGTTQKPIANDKPDTMRTVVDAMLIEASRVLRHDSCCCCCCCGGGGGPSPTFAWVANRMDEQGLQFFHSVIWDKRNPGLGWRYRRQHEMVMVAHRRGGRLSWAENAKAQRNIISIAAPRNRLHPNEKPLDLVRRFIELHTEPGDTVLDPFGGSMTTGVACVDLGRKFIGIELDDAFFKTGVRRIKAAIAGQDTRNLAFAA